MGFSIGFLKSKKEKGDNGKTQSKRKVKKLSSKPVQLSNIILEANLDAKYDVGESDSFIRTQYDGQPAIFGMALFIDSIGGFSSNTRGDEDKGSIIEYINADVIHHITSKEILNKNIIIFLPTRDTLDEMGEYTSLFGSESALYHIVYILKDGFKYVDTGKTVAFGDVISVMEDGSNFEEVLPNAKLDKKHSLIYDLPDMLLDGETVDGENKDGTSASDEDKDSDDKSKSTDKKKSVKEDKQNKKRGKKKSGGFFGFGKKASKEDDDIDDKDVKDGDDADTPEIIDGDNDDDGFDIPIPDDGGDSQPESEPVKYTNPVNADINGDGSAIPDIPPSEPSDDGGLDGDGHTSDPIHALINPSADNTPEPIVFKPVVNFTDENHIDIDGEKFVKESYIDNSEFYAVDNDLRIKVNTRNMFNERYQFSEPRLFNYEDILSDYTERGNDWFAKSVSLMCLTSNNDFVERQEKFKNSLYTEFRSSVDKTLSIISSLYSITTTDTSYGKAIASINASKQDATKNLSQYVDETKATIQKTYDEERSRWVMAQVKILEGQYDDTHGFELDNKLSSVQTDIERQINVTFDSKLNEIKENRFIEAQRAFSAELIKVYDKFENKYNDFLLAETAKFEEVKGKISNYIDENKSVAYDNLRQLKLKLETDKRFEEETARHEAMMQQLRDTFNADKENLNVKLNAKQEDIERITKDYQDELRRISDDNKVKVDTIEAEYRDKINSIEAGYEDKIERDRARHNEEIRNYKEQVESLKTSVDTVNAGFSSFDARTRGIDRIQTRMIFITVAVAIVVAVAGFFVGNTHGMKTAIDEMNAYNNSTNLVPGENNNFNKGGR